MARKESIAVDVSILLVHGDQHSSWFIFQMIPSLETYACSRMIPLAHQCSRLLDRYGITGATHGHLHLQWRTDAYIAHPVRYEQAPSRIISCSHQMSGSASSAKEHDHAGTHAMDIRDDHSVLHLYGRSKCAKTSRSPRKHSFFSAAGSQRVSYVLLRFSKWLSIQMTWITLQR